MISIIIPYHNEGKEFIEATLKSIRQTIDVVHEIIIIDDCSDIPLQLDNDVFICRHYKNYGVGRAFDTGIEFAKYENIILMGCDIRFMDNGWASKMQKEINSHKKSLICSAVVPLTMEEYLITDGQYEVAFNRERVRAKYHGAKINFLHDSIQSPDRPDEFRSILDAQWLDREIYSLFRPEENQAARVRGKF